MASFKDVKKTEKYISKANFDALDMTAVEEGTEFNIVDQIYESDLDSDILQKLNNNAKLNTANTFTAAQTFNKDITINGNIIQNGTTYKTHTEELYTKKDIIFTREGAQSALGNNEYTGIQAVKYDGEHDGQLVFDKDGIARVGDVGDTQALATRDDTIADNHLVQWNLTDKKLVDSGKQLSDFATLAGTNNFTGFNSFINTVSFMANPSVNIYGSVDFYEGASSYGSFVPDTTDDHLLTYKKDSAIVTFPNKSGTLAVLEDIPTNLSNGTGSYSVKQLYGDNSAIASGINSIALGGKRYDKLTDSTRTETSSEGAQSLAAGGSVHAHADWTVALGADNDAYLKCSTVSGKGNQAGPNGNEKTNYTIASSFGNDGNPARNQALSHTWDYGEYADSNASGVLNKALGFASDASNGENIAFGHYSTAKGYQNVAAGDHSTVIGSNNFAKGQMSFSGGNGCISNGEGAVTFGKGTQALGAYSVAIGEGTIAKGNNQLVVGKYNNENSAALFLIGCGTNEKRKDAFKINYDGKCEISNRLKVEGTIFGTSNIYLSDSDDTTGDYSVNIVSGSETVEPHIEIANTTRYYKDRIEIGNLLSGVDPIVLNLPADSGMLISKPILDTTLEDYATLTGSNSFTGANNFSGNITCTATGSQFYGLRLKNSTPYGCKLNFGDGEYAYISEPNDDQLNIYAKNGVVIGTLNGTNPITINGNIIASATNNFTGDTTFSKTITSNNGIKGISFVLNQTDLITANTAQLILGGTASSSSTTDYKVGFIKNKGYTLTLPTKTGTVATTSDIKIKSASLSGTTLYLTL